ncbi:hypothetical protein SJAG_03304 [Schizosaccharomyces japonicus yFS275]|uniref:Uncharacterized protein n=1 Tax=Schizosaccharomyces japonicus (strain yFS275 / FY16936) TaxID=402676 RepID=B6K3W2_SCHJY|nr:hypothetical protein SJAG_03304 [Schizosaccharomyces japonicus yFS275]EEB08169.1 hypothetical protein SJAG_03304 [Schizosaccharomyces japonicus yFS275]
MVRLTVSEVYTFLDNRAVPAQDGDEHSKPLPSALGPVLREPSPIKSMGATPSLSNRTVSTLRSLNATPIRSPSNSWRLSSAQRSAKLASLSTSTGSSSLKFGLVSQNPTPSKQRLQREHADTDAAPAGTKPCIVVPKRITPFATQVTRTPTRPYLNKDAFFSIQPTAHGASTSSALRMPASASRIPLGTPSRVVKRSALSLAEPTRMHSPSRAATVSPSARSTSPKYALSDSNLEPCSSPSSPTPILAGNRYNLDAAETRDLLTKPLDEELKVFVHPKLTQELHDLRDADLNAVAHVSYAKKNSKETSPEITQLPPSSPSIPILPKSTVTRITKENTKRNKKYRCNFEKVIVTETKSRPPSPNARLMSVQARQERSRRDQWAKDKGYSFAAGDEECWNPNSPAVNTRSVKWAPEIECDAQSLKRSSPSTVADRPMKGCIASKKVRRKG